jgi:hypothetical protein
MINLIDYLGGAKYRPFIKANHPRGFGAGVFLNTFDSKDGTGRDVVRQLCEMGATACPFIRVHSIWDDNHRYNSKVHDPIIIRDYKWLCAMQAKYRSIVLVFSFFCENTMSSDEINAIVKKLQAISGNMLIVNSTMRNFVTATDKLWNEVHGTKMSAPRGNYIFGWDGITAFGTDIPGLLAKHKNAKGIAWWISQFNCKMKDEAVDSKNKYIVPSKRYNVLDAKTFDILVNLAIQTKNKGTKLPDKYIYKTVSDQHYMPPRGKDCMPVLIAPPSIANGEFIAKTPNGQEIAKFTYLGNWVDKTSGKVLGQRFYAYSTALELYEKSKRLGGKGLAILYRNGKEVGTIDLLYRENDERKS